MVSRFFQSPSIYVRKLSLHLCFLTIFLSYNCYYEKFSDGTIKNIQDEIPFDLPNGWSWTKLKNIVIKEIKRGKAPVYTNKSNVLVFAQKCNLKRGGINIDLAQYLDETTLKKYSVDEFLRINDIVINSTGTGTLGRVGILHKDCFSQIINIVPDTHVTVVRVHDAIVSDYVFITLKQMQAIIETKGEGSTNQKELRPEYIKKIFIPIPPYNEQIRIVGIVEESFNTAVIVDSVDNELKNIISLLKSKILELAIQGKLVPQDENDEPASVLLERIRTERKAKLGKKYVESYIYKGDDNCYYENNNGKVLLVNDFLPFDLPEEWAYVRLENVLNYEQPTEYIVESTDYRNEYKTPVLTAGKSFIIGYTNETTGIKNDLPVIIFDDFTTDSKYVDFPFKVKSSAMKILTADKSLIDTKYAYYIMQTVECDHETHKRYWISEYGRTIIGLPPLNEQLKITSQIEYLFSLLDNVKEP